MHVIDDTTAASLIFSVRMKGSGMIAKRLKAARLKAGLTQEELGLQLGVTLNTLCRWERGKREPRGLYRKAIERWLSSQKQQKHGLIYFDGSQWQRIEPGIPTSFLKAASNVPPEWPPKDENEED